MRKWRSSRKESASIRGGGASPSEHQEQVALIQWARLTRVPAGLLPPDAAHRVVGDYLIAVPNGAYLGPDAKGRGIHMARLKAEGFRPGVADLLLALPLRGYPGLWIEMKANRSGARETKAQQEMRKMLESVGWLCTVARGFDDARAAILSYLGE